MVYTSILFTCETFVCLYHHQMSPNAHNLYGDFYTYNMRKYLDVIHLTIMRQLL